MAENERGKGHEGQEHGDKVPIALFLLPGLSILVMAAAIVISFVR